MAKLTFYIAHRGNTNGTFESYENEPNYIDAAIKKGFYVEVDVWKVDNFDFNGRRIDSVLFLGHDKPQYGVTPDFFDNRKDKLWIHCKNIEALEWFSMFGKYYNYFWHEFDKATMTSHGHIWAYPGMQPIRGSIAVLPELYDDKLDACKGICSDFIDEFLKKDIA